MSNWIQLAWLAFVAFPIGIALGLLARRNPAGLIAGYFRLGQTMPWQFYFAAAIFFAILTIHASFLSVLVVFALAMVLQGTNAVLAMKRDGVQFTVTHLLFAAIGCVIWITLLSIIGRDLEIATAIAAASIAATLLVVQVWKVMCAVELITQRKRI